MIIQSDKIREDLKYTWPDLKFVVLSDPTYFQPTLQQLSDKLNEFKNLDYEYIPKLFECEEFALAFMNHCRSTRAKEYDGSDPKFNWPLGIVVGTKFNGELIDHWVCICSVRDNELLLIDPQDGAKWQPSGDKDNIYFLLM